MDCVSWFQSSLWSVDDAVAATTHRVFCGISIYAILLRKHRKSDQRNLLRQGPTHEVRRIDLLCICTVALHHSQRGRCSLRTSLQSHFVVDEEEWLSSFSSRLSLPRVEASDLFGVLLYEKLWPIYVVWLRLQQHLCAVLYPSTDLCFRSLGRLGRRPIAHPDHAAAG